MDVLFSIYRGHISVQETGSPPTLITRGETSFSKEEGISHLKKSDRTFYGSNARELLKHTAYSYPELVAHFINGGAYEDLFREMRQQQVLQLLLKYAPDRVQEFLRKCEDNLSLFKYLARVAPGYLNQQEDDSSSEDGEEA